MILPKKWSIKRYFKRRFTLRSWESKERKYFEIIITKDGNPEVGVRQREQIIQKQQLVIDNYKGISSSNFEEKAKKSVALEQRIQELTEKVAIFVNH